MQSKVLHIISFDNPFPPNYGGIIDVFYKIKALHALGVKIHLHCFTANKTVAEPELKAITEAVYFYKKDRNFLFHFSLVPFGVRSRYQKSLIENLKLIDAPILFDGLQTTYLLKKTDFKERKKYLRLHNIESDYYKGIANSESDFFKRMLYKAESYKYKNYQQIIGDFDKVFTLSVFEDEYVNELYGNSCYLPVFHGNQKVNNLFEFGAYALYHGDLRLSDNRKAADFLISIFKNIPDVNFIIASNHGQEEVEKQIKNHLSIRFVKIKSKEHLNELLAKAHVNVMLSFQRAGTKLKLINSLYNSRHCLINKNMVDDKRILSLCEVASTESEFKVKINALKIKPYADSKRREFVLDEVFNDFTNAQKIIEVIF